MFNGSASNYPSALQVLINNGDGTFQDETATLNPSMSLNEDELDYNPQFVDLDHSGINSYLFGKFTDQGASRQSNYLILNDGTGHLYIALHDQFQALDTAVQSYVAANYTVAQGYSLDPTGFSKYMGVPQADGSVDYVAQVEVSHSEGNGVVTTQYVFVNVPLEYDPTTDFTQDCDITNRNGSTLIRTWAGDDTFHDADAGPTTHIDGGLGANTSIYSGVIADYTISADATGVHVISKSGMGVPAVNDTLVNVQTLQFADETITDSENTNGVYELTYPASPVITGTTVVTQSVVMGGVETSSTVGTGPITFDGGTLKAGANNLVFANAVAINSTGGTVDLNGDMLTLAGAITDGTGSPAGALTVTDSSTGTQGVLVLNAANTYSGATTIHAGTLELDASTTLSGAAIASGAAGIGPIHFGGAGTLQVDGVALNAGDLAYAITGFAGGDVIDVRGIGQTDTAVYDASTGTLSLEHGATVNATLHIGTGYGDDVFTAASDLHGGTEVVVAAPPPAPPPPPPSSGGSTTGGDAGSSGGIDETLGSGPASLQGYDSADSLSAGSGADTLLGGGGDDSLIGGSGSDQLYGNAGNDTITLTAMTQSSTVYGGQGDDTIDASASTHANFISGDLGNDTIILGSGADTAYAGSGNDSITAGSGEDQIYGNAGDDHVGLGAASGASTVYAGQGNDAIDASSSTHSDFISGDLGNDTITLGSGADTAYGGDGDDTITAGSGAAQIYGNAGDDHISLVASSASSTVYAGQGNDTIDASASTHANYISGDLGDDMIIAGSGGDTIHGGAGSDTIQASASGPTYIHAGLADSSATSATGASALDHVMGFNSQTKLIFDGDPAATGANTVVHGGDSAITGYAAAYAYAYGDGATQGAISGAVDYAVVSDTAGHVYVFAHDHAAVEIDGLASGVSGVAIGQILAS